MSSFVETLYQANKQNDRIPPENEGQARACSLPEIASLVELSLIGSMTREEAVLAVDPYSIDAIIRESDSFSHDSKDPDAPELLLEWSDRLRSLTIFAEDVAYPPERADPMSGLSGLMLLREDSWLGSGHLKEIFEEWAMQYAADRHEAHHPSIVLRERLLYRWKGHMERMLHHLDEGVLSVALVSGADIRGKYPENAAYLADLRDIQLEALFRASLACYRQGMEHRLEILVSNPADMEEWTYLHELIERVAEETLCHQRRAVAYSIGALIGMDVDLELAADLARCAKLLVLNCSGMSHPEHPWTRANLRRMEALAGCIRNASRHIPLRASGLQNAADLSAIYAMGVDEISVLSGALPVFRLASAQWELQTEANAGKRYSCDGCRIYIK
ncbi:hypothetical protein GRF59_27500 [Paenibacillus sp. HJL G12]|uniref:Uncharacterized protein n=1 Tax=Paenibacillus dendrobii TaxID=2691084 RepID=A0A7X3LIU5_9BACL|nr:hypothetical protein [Paenibacillus dendrobii]MWV47346.1 hypothetical protein [Paenibacillus dendrobii]